MTPPPLSDDQRALLSARADEFHAALARGAAGDWDPFLAGLPADLRPAVLAELVAIDLAHRYARGERPRVEEYVGRFPELGPRDRVPAAVIVEECRCRAKAGESVDPVSYAGRFPAQYPKIRGELESAGRPTAGGTIKTTLVGSGDRPPASAPAPGPGEAGDYQFLRILGRGVFGEVWLARKVTSGIEKAVKILLQPDDRESAARERESLELIKNLRHPYLLATEDFWVSGGRLHVVMELAEGTLRHRLHRCREAGLPGIPPGELLGYLWEAAEGLDFLHARRVVHRDVKPDNILLVNGHAKVADFGLARHQETTLAPVRTLAGTPSYMAPEVWGMEAGPASDQYSLAITYLELRQGSAPLRPRPIEEMLAAHQAGAYEFAESIGPGERAVLAKALSRTPADRYRSCREFAEALSSAAGRPGVPRASGTVPISPGLRKDAPPEPTHPDTGVPAPKPAEAPTDDDDFAPPPPPGSRPRDRRRERVAAVALVLVGALGLGLWALFGRGDHSPGGGGNDGSSDVRMPAKFEPEPGSRDFVLANRRKVYQWIRTTVGDETVRFRLALATGGANPVEPFYIMESKVWNALYRAGGREPPAESATFHPDAPVTGITAEEAADFARDVFGGRLPSKEEWDQAAGYPNHRDTVTRPGGHPRVRLARPEPTHGPGAGDDVNDNDLIDMAGNGREWTASVLDAKPVTRALGPTDLLILRGRSYTLSRGLTFGMIDAEQKEPQTQYAAARSPYTSFRVVVPVP